MIGIIHRIHERFVKQLDGSALGGQNCTMAAGASSVHRHTLGRRSPSGSTLRKLSGDTSGGTNLDQLRVAITRYLGRWSGWDGPHRGLPMGSFYARLRAGRGAVVQGSSRATYGTKWRASFTFRGNHAWYVARGKGWSLVKGVWKPAYLLIFDPLADGRRAGIAKSPFWIPRSYFEKFCAYLSFGGYETLGFGRVYALMTRDTVEHRHATVAGAVFYRATRKVKGGFNVRSRPGGTSLRKTKAGETFPIYQKLSTGPSVGGSRVWYGDHSGTRWVHSSGLA